jgi:hypothetical protein
MLDALRAVEIPGEAGAALAAARLVVGQILAGAGIVGLLHLERHQAVLDEDFPGTAAGAVHAVGRAHDLVVLPAMAIGIFPVTILVGDDAVVVGEGFLRFFEKPQSVQKMTHVCLLMNAVCGCAAYGFLISEPARR